MGRIEQDTTARTTALDPARSFIVEAPAGSGKTELIAQRFLRLLAVVDAPEEIVALTFTNKAAGEMRARILEALHAASQPLQEGAPAHKQTTWNLATAALARDRARDWNLREQPARLRITTIDSLCASLARQMPLLSRFGQNPGISDAPGDAWQEAADSLLAEVEDNPQVARMLARLDNDSARFSRLIVAMLARRDQWLHHPEHPRAEIEAGYAALVADRLEFARAVLGANEQATLMPPVRYALSALTNSALNDWQQPLTDDPAELPQWRALAGLLLTGSGSLRKQFDKRNGFPADADGRAMKAAMLEAMAQLPAAAEAALATVLALPEPTLAEAEVAAIADAAALLKRAAAALWLAFQRRGEVDFIEIAARARQALGEEDAPTDLALALDYRIHHLLIDEFQDTSEAQMQLFEALTRGWSPGDGRSLFLVGDPMQSIYRFRKAEVGLFLQVRDHGLNTGIRPEPLALFRNNRSRPAVIEWVNAAFPAIFGDEDSLRGEVAYRDCVATKPDLPDAGVFTHTASDPEALAARALTLIRDERAARPKASIAVLVRARAHLAPLLEALRRDAPEIACRAVEIAPLAQRQAVADLLSLTRALMHRADRLHWLACLRAPWCGLTLADLLAVTGDAAQEKLPEATVWQQILAALNTPSPCPLPMNGERVPDGSPRPACGDQPAGRRTPQQWRSRASPGMGLGPQRGGGEGMSADGRRRLAHFAAALDWALDQDGRLPLRERVFGAWQRLLGPQCLRHASDFEDAMRYLDLLESLQDRPDFDAARLQAAMDRLYAAPEGDDHAVQLMTLHKSKGLEFDSVLLFGLEAGARSDTDAPPLRWDEVITPHGERHTLVSCLPFPAFPAAEREVAQRRHDWIRAQESARQAAELKRLLYVGATRARDRLHLLACIDSDDEGIKPPPTSSLLALLWPGLSLEAAEERRGEGGRGKGEGVQDGLPLLRLREVPVADDPVGLRCANPTYEMEPSPHSWGEGRVRGNDPTYGRLPSASLDAAVGTLVHRGLELMAKLAHRDVERVPALASRYADWLLQRGFSAPEAEAGAARVVAALCGCLQSEAGRWVLQDHPEAVCEYALLADDATHRIDRSFVHDGVRWIVDYKTVATLDNPQQEAARHREQLQRYGDLFARLEPNRRQQWAVLFVAQGELVLLQPLAGGGE